MKPVSERFVARARASFRPLCRTVVAQSTGCSSLSRAQVLVAVRCVWLRRTAASRGRIPRRIAPYEWFEKGSPEALGSAATRIGVGL